MATKKKDQKKKSLSLANILMMFLTALLLLLLMFLSNLIPHRIIVSASLIAIIISYAVGAVILAIDKKSLLPILLASFPISFGAHLILLFTCNYTFADPSPLFIVSAILGIALSAFITFRFFREDTKLPALIGWLLLFALVFFALFLLFSFHLNYALDFYPPTLCEAVIEDKDIAYHNKSPDDYELIVTVDGQEISLEVSYDAYQNHKIGDTYTFYRYRGAFGIPFYFKE